MTSYRRPVSSPRASASSGSLADLYTYLSRLELELIANEGAAHSPSEERFDGALLFVDVSGFTPITEALAKQGPRGAELLSEILNDYYGRLTNLVDSYGGDVLFFAGDAAVALFRVDGAPLADAVRPCVACGLEVRRELDGFATSSAPGFRLSLRAMVGAGALRALRVGSNPRLTLVTGTAMAQVAELGSLKAARGVVVAASAHSLLAGETISQRVSRHAFDVTALQYFPEKRARTATTSIPGLEAVERALPAVVVQRTRAGQTEFLAEFRTLSVVFVGLSLGGHPTLMELHHAATTLGELVARFEGAVYQFLEDDKGLTLVASFGIPPRAHEDDAARSALFAVAAAADLRELGGDPAIGVATGRLFCGAYGGDSRKQYSLVGPAINRAARLMQAARDHGVLCDDATRRAAGRQADFESLGSLSLKGLEEPVLVSRPRADSPRSSRQRSSIPASVGRDEEREALTIAVDALVSGRSDGPILLVAEAGMGKSHMMGELHAIAEKRGVRIVRGDADSMETKTPYFAFRTVFAELTDVVGLEAREAQVRVLEALSEGRDLSAIAPLLSVVLPLDWAETPLTQQMTPQIRAENLTRLLLHLLGRAAEQEPFLLVLEDGHWLDSASWALLALVRRLVPRATIVVTMRPMDHEPPDCAKLREGAMRLALPPMNREQTIEILVHRLGVPTVPAEFVDFVVTRAEGNPFYIEEIAYSLRDSGHVRIEGTELEAPAGWAALAGLSFPDSLEAVITSRIDRLTAAEQLALKVASVVGRHFEEAAVLEALPVVEDRAGLPGVLARLQQLDLLVPESDAAWTFRHAVTRETTYGLLSYSQRRSLHRAVAEHLERRHESDLSPLYARLAQHWSLAEDSAKAATAYGNAGAQSLGAYANEEAMVFLTRALALDGETNRGTAFRRSRWLELLGEAHYSLAGHDAARAAYEGALRELGFVPPSGAAGATRQLFEHLLRRARERVTGRAAAPVSAEKREALKHAMKVLEELGAVLLWQGARTSFLESAFLGRNLADRVGPCGASAGAMSGAGYVLAMMGLHGLAERDLARAVALAEENEPILPKIQAYLMQGMFLSFMGRAEQALHPLRRSGVLADELGGGLWKHRAKFMLGEPLILLGSYDEAGHVFEEAAAHSIGAEPTVVGFSYAMQALSRLRLGNVDSALALLEGPLGVEVIRSTTVPLQLFASLGPLAEARLARGDVEGALGAIREAERAAPGEEANGYFAGIHGHAAACQVYLSIAEGAVGPAPLDRSAALSSARRAVKRFSRFARTFPGAMASLRISMGRLSAQSGDVRGGLRLLDSAANEASEKKLPYEEASAHFHAARYVGKELRPARLRRAAELFARFGMKRELERVESS